MTSPPLHPWASNSASGDNNSPQNTDCANGVARRSNQKTDTRNGGDEQEEVPDPEQYSALATRLDEPETENCAAEARQPSGGRRVGSGAERPCQAQEHRGHDELRQIRGHGQKLTCALSAHSTAPCTRR